MTSKAPTPPSKTPTKTRLIINNLSSCTTQEALSDNDPSQDDFKLEAQTMQNVIAGDAVTLKFDFIENGEFVSPDVASVTVV